jgi:hypothetical protein
MTARLGLVELGVPAVTVSGNSPTSYRCPAQCLPAAGLQPQWRHSHRGLMMHWHAGRGSFCLRMMCWPQPLVALLAGVTHSAGHLRHGGKVHSQNH